MFMVFTRMFFIHPAAASCTRSSSEPVNVSKVCGKQREKMPTSQFEHLVTQVKSVHPPTGLGPGLIPFSVTCNWELFYSPWLRG